MNVEQSKFLSLVLRHKPEKIGIKLDKEGWTDVGILLDKANLSMSELEDIVKNNNKSRFSFNQDKTKIRANQGHSLSEVQINFKPVRPPEQLFHGTADRFVSSIQKKGLIKGNRNHVHLSDRLETAISVGSRHGKVVIFLVDSGAMYRDGYKFYLSENKVWLTDFVPSKYLFLKKIN